MSNPCIEGWAVPGSTAMRGMRQRIFETLPSPGPHDLDAGGVVAAGPGVLGRAEAGRGRLPARHLGARIQGQNRFPPPENN